MVNGSPPDLKSKWVGEPDYIKCLPQSRGETTRTQRSQRSKTIYLSPTGRTLVQCSVSMPLSTSFKWSHHQMIVMMAIIQRKRQDTNFAVDHLRYFRDVPLVCLLEAHFYLKGTKVEDFPGCNPLGRRLHRDCYNCLHCQKSLWWTDLDSFCSITCG